MTGQTGQVISRPVYAPWDEMATPIKYGLRYRSLTLTLTLTLKLTQTLTLKVTIMYAVQNDTEIKFNIVLYVKVIFVGQRVGIQKAYTAKRKSSLI